MFAHRVMRGFTEEVDEQRANPPPSRPAGNVIRFSDIYIAKNRYSQPISFKTLFVE